MFPVAVMAGAAWVFLLVVLLIVPPPPGPRRGGGPGGGRDQRSRARWPAVAADQMARLKRGPG